LSPTILSLCCTWIKAWLGLRCFVGMASKSSVEGEYGRPPPGSSATGKERRLFPILIASSLSYSSYSNSNLYTVDLGTTTSAAHTRTPTVQRPADRIDRLQFPYERIKSPSPLFTMAAADLERDPFYMRYVRGWRF
jgi:hypothetical protein